MYVVYVDISNNVSAALSLVSEHGANNFATIRTTSIVTKQQKEHNQASHTLIYFIFFFPIILQTVVSSEPSKGLQKQGMNALVISIYVYIVSSRCK